MTAREPGTLGAEATELRIKGGMTQERAAAALGVTIVHLNRIERGKAMPSLGMLERYDRVFGMNPYVSAWLLTEAGQAFLKRWSGR